jgi:molybdate transport system ATP-binding protein
MSIAKHSSGLEIELYQPSPIPLDAEFSCAAGEVLGLVGPSGSGKSTVLRAVAGLFTPTHGRVRCGDESWLDTSTGTSVPTTARSVGMVFQSYALFPHMSAAKNIETALGHLPSAQRADRARELLAQVHLDGLANRLPRELSGGQQQRVAVARALARDPKVLLLDEPFSAVDRVTRQKLYRELAELRKSLGMPVVLVTHDLDEAAMLCDRISILHHGRTLQTAAPDELMHKPFDRLVARVIDCKNIFEGRIDRHHPDTNTTMLNWQGQQLEVLLDQRFAVGATVDWMIPSSGLILHRRDRPSRGEHENPLYGTVAELTRLGDITSIAFSPTGTSENILHFAIQSHVAQRNQLESGVSIGVSLLKESIHLMVPRDEPAET